MVSAWEVKDEEDMSRNYRHGWRQAMWVTGSALAHLPHQYLHVDRKPVV